MLTSDVGGPDVFFDSVDYFSPEQSFVANEEVVSKEIQYDIWMNEPRSIKERREGFLRVMGLSEDASSILTRGTKMVIGECNGLVSDNCTELSYNENQANSTGEVAHGSDHLYEEFTRDGDEEDKADLASQPKAYESSTCVLEERDRDADVHAGSRNRYLREKKLKNWWKHLVNGKQREDKTASVLGRASVDAKMTSKMKVKRNRKKWMELTGVYRGQEIKAHKGLIWTMKFSPDGQYLASGGEDGVVRVWRVSSMYKSSNSSTAADKFLSNVKDDMLDSLKKQSSHTPVVLPKEVFHIEDLPIQEFYGHSSGVLDLAWSDSNLILSASKDRTARLWQIDCDQCLDVFHHNDYVTCLQFNPVEENYFISGSLDGKIRIWGVSERRVVDWADIKDGITAISYQPNGNGFMVGSLTGCCRVYVTSGQHIQLGAKMYVQEKKNASRNKITGIQFSRKNCQRAIVASEDSKIRIFDGTDVVRKYKGLLKSGSQKSASCTSTGKHVVSVGEDSHVYVWNLSETNLSLRKTKKSVRSCEYFFSEGVTVAVPWSGVSQETTFHSSEMRQCIEGTFTRFPESFSLSSWLASDSACRGSMTWPEESLPVYDVPVVADNFVEESGHGHQREQPLIGNSHHWTSFSETWGLVIVTADSNGTIKTFHNFGLPMKL